MYGRSLVFVVVHTRNYEASTTWRTWTLPILSQSVYPLSLYPLPVQVFGSSIGGWVKGFGASGTGVESSERSHQTKDFVLKSRLNMCVCFVSGVGTRFNRESAGLYEHSPTYKRRIFLSLCIFIYLPYCFRETPQPLTPKSSRLYYAKT